MSHPRLPPELQQRFVAALRAQQRGAVAEAIAAYREIVRLAPDYCDALNNLALLCKQQGAWAEAESLYRRALAVMPEEPEILGNLATLLLACSRLDESEAALCTALRVQPDYIAGWNNLGNVLQGAYRFEDAAVAYGEALQRGARCLGQLEAGGARAAAAVHSLRTTLAETAWNQSLLHLLLGRYDSGWTLLEARYDRARLQPIPLPPELPFPQWQGETLAGKSILVWFEQGFGDEIQFARYLPWLKTQGAARVTLVCKPPLVDLLATVPGVDRVLAGAGQFVIPLHDYWVLPMSLPRWHRTTLATIPAVLPYVAALPDRQALWRERLPPRSREKPRRIGLVWAGRPSHRNDGNRSLPGLQTLAPLAAVTDAHFISLQKGAREDEALQAPAGLALTPLGGMMGDFADTAAIVSQLDLVLTVDTAVAHVAGALNKPCWILLPRLGLDWRWLLERNDSPWYPGCVRLFRQRVAGDWSGVVAEVLQALRENFPEPDPCDASFSV